MKFPHHWPSPERDISSASALSPPPAAPSYSGQITVTSDASSGNDAVAAAGQRSESEGEEPNRRVVVYPAQ